MSANLITLKVVKNIHTIANKITLCSPGGSGGSVGYDGSAAGKGVCVLNSCRRKDAAGGAFLIIIARGGAASVMIPNIARRCE